MIAVRRADGLATSATLGILLTDPPTIFRSCSPETDAAMIRKIKNVGATLVVALATPARAPHPTT